MNYDDWKTETPDDERARLYGRRHHDMEPLGVIGGQCACGRATLRSLAGLGWQCDDCYRTYLRAQYEQRARTA